MTIQYHAAQRQNYDYPIISETIDGKEILKTKITLCENDVFIVVSDGVLHASGGPFDFGWEHKDVVEFLSGFTATAQRQNHSHHAFGAVRRTVRRQAWR